MKEENDVKKEETKQVSSKSKSKSTNLKNASKTTTKNASSTDSKTTAKQTKSKGTNSKSGTGNKTANKTSKSSTTNTTKNTTSGSKKQSPTTVKAKNEETKTKSKKENVTESKAISKTKLSNNSSTKKSTTKNSSTKKKKSDESIDIAFIDNDNEEDLIDISNEKLLIDQKELEEKQLNAIKDVIKKNKKEKKSKATKQAKYKKILKNILIGMVEILYFLILIVGKAAIPTIEYITSLKTFIITEMIASIIIFEVSYKKDNDELFLHGVEMMIVASATLVYLHYFSMQSSILNIIGAVIIGIIVAYYLIKSIIIAIKKNKKN